MSIPGFHTFIPSHMLLLGLIASPHHHPVKSMFILQNSDPTELPSPPQALWQGMGAGVREAGVELGGEDLLPRLPPPGWALRGQPQNPPLRSWGTEWWGWRRGSAELGRRPRSLWLRRLAACSVKDRAGMSEFPWEWAEASKQLGRE